MIKSYLLKIYILSSKIYKNDSIIAEKGDKMLTKSPETRLYSEFLSCKDADDLFNYLNNLKGWKRNQYNGNKLGRETLVFVNEEIFANPEKFKIPEIWGKDVIILPFPKNFLYILDFSEQMTGQKYNIVLGNRYIKNKDKIAFHSDNEEFGDTQSIASLSLGVTRTFTFMAKTLDEKISLKLDHGSLLYMGKNCQENYTHGMQREKVETHPKYDKTRINLTFRIWNYLK